MDELPKRMTFIGVGIISVEFASIMIKSGVEVTMIHHSDKPLKGFNQTHVTQLIKKLEDEGVHFYFDEETQKVEK